MEAQVMTLSGGVKFTNQFSDKDNPLFKDIYETLKKHDALKRFGVTLLQDDYTITDDEVMLETTNTISREQTIKPYPASFVNSQEAIETSWRLDTGSAVMSCKCITGTAEGGHQHHSRG
jgi:hypothetical protein